MKADKEDNLWPEDANEANKGILRGTSARTIRGELEIIGKHSPSRYNEDRAESYFDDFPMPKKNLNENGKLSPLASKAFVQTIRDKAELDKLKVQQTIARLRDYRVENFIRAKA